MKKLVICTLATLAVMFIASLVPGKAEAVKALPPGAKVSATCNSDNTATVTIKGVDVIRAEKYNYGGTKYVTTDPNNVRFNLDEGKRFSFMFDRDDPHYPALGAGQKKSRGGGASFLGDNVDVDDDPDGKGHAFVVTCQ